MPEMKIPSPDHPLRIVRNPRRVEALYNGHIIADSACAVVVREADLEEVYYFPKEDVQMEVMLREAYTTHCAYKGDATYWRIFRDGQFAEHGAWSYESPYPAAEDLRGLIAFDPKAVTFHVDEHAEDPVFAQKDRIGDYIRHTDSGSGRSQEAPWAANVGRPDPESGERDEDQVPLPGF